MGQRGYGHVQPRLGLYVLSALPTAEQDEVEQHLDACPACLAEYAELNEVTSALALLSKEDVRGLADEFDLAPRAPTPLRGPSAMS